MITITKDELRQMIRHAITSALADVISAEVRRTMNHARGRLDDDLSGDPAAEIARRAALAQRIRRTF